MPPTITLAEAQAQRIAELTHALLCIRQTFEGDGGYFTTTDVERADLEEVYLRACRATKVAPRGVSAEAMRAVEGGR